MIKMKRMVALSLTVMRCKILISFMSMVLKNGGLKIVKVGIYLVTQINM